MGHRFEAELEFATSCQRAGAGLFYGRQEGKGSGDERRGEEGAKCRLVYSVVSQKVAAVLETLAKKQDALK